MRVVWCLFPVFFAALSLRAGVNGVRIESPVVWDNRSLTDPRGCGCTSASAIEGDLIAIAGRTSNAEAFEIDQNDPSIIIKHHYYMLNAARTYIGIAIVRGSIVTAGGLLDDDATATDAIEIYNITSESVDSSRSYGVGIYGTAGASIDDGDEAWVVFAGGFTTAKVYSNEIKAFRLEPTWNYVTLGALLDDPIAHSASCSLPQMAVFAGGQENGLSWTETGYVVMYDGSDTFSIKAKFALSDRHENIVGSCFGDASAVFVGGMNPATVDYFGNVRGGTAPLTYQFTGVKKMDVSATLLGNITAVAGGITASVYEEHVFLYDAGVDDVERNVSLSLGRSCILSESAGDIMFFFGGNDTETSSSDIIDFFFFNDLYVASNGTGSTCSDSYPCSLETALNVVVARTVAYSAVNFTIHLDTSETYSGDYAIQNVDFSRVSFMPSSVPAFFECATLNSPLFSLYNVSNFVLKEISVSGCEKGLFHISLCSDIDISSIMLNSGIGCARLVAENGFGTAVGGAFVQAYNSTNLLFGEWIVTGNIDCNFMSSAEGVRGGMFRFESSDNVTLRNITLTGTTAVKFDDDLVTSELSGGSFCAFRSCNHVVIADISMGSIYLSFMKSTVSPAYGALWFEDTSVVDISSVSTTSVSTTHADPKADSMISGVFMSVIATTPTDMEDFIVNGISIGEARAGSSYFRGLYFYASFAGGFYEHSRMTISSFQLTKVVFLVDNSSECVGSLFYVAGVGSQAIFEGLEFADLSIVPSEGDMTALPSAFHLNSVTDVEFDADRLSMSDLSNSSKVLYYVKNVEKLRLRHISVSNVPVVVSVDGGKDIEVDQITCSNAQGGGMYFSGVDGLRLSQFSFENLVSSISPTIEACSNVNIANFICIECAWEADSYSEVDVAASSSSSATIGGPSLFISNSYIVSIEYFEGSNGFLNASFPNEWGIDVPNVAGGMILLENSSSVRISNSSFEHSRISVNGNSTSMVGGGSIAVLRSPNTTLSGCDIEYSSIDFGDSIRETPSMIVSGGGVLVVNSPQFAIETGSTTIESSFISLPTVSASIYAELESIVALGGGLGIVYDSNMDWGTVGTPPLIDSLLVKNCSITEATSSSCQNYASHPASLGSGVGMYIASDTPSPPNTFPGYSIRFKGLTLEESTLQGCAIDGLRGSGLYVGSESGLLWGDDGQFGIEVELSSIAISNDEISTSNNGNTTSLLYFSNTPRVLISTQNGLLTSFEGIGFSRFAYFEHISKIEVSDLKLNNFSSAFGFEQCSRILLDSVVFEDSSLSSSFAYDSQIIGGSVALFSSCSEIDLRDVAIVRSVSELDDGDCAFSFSRILGGAILIANSSDVILSNISCSNCSMSVNRNSLVSGCGGAFIGGYYTRNITLESISSQDTSLSCSLSSPPPSLVGDDPVARGGSLSFVNCPQFSMKSVSLSETSIGALGNVIGTSGCALSLQFFDNMPSSGESISISNLVIEGCDSEASGGSIVGGGFAIVVGGRQGDDTDLGMSVGGSGDILLNAIELNSVSVNDAGNGECDSLGRTFAIWTSNPGVMWDGRLSLDSITLLDPTSSNDMVHASLVDIRLPNSSLEWHSSSSSSSYSCNGGNGFVFIESPMNVNISSITIDSCPSTLTVSNVAGDVDLNAISIDSYPSTLDWASWTLLSTCSSGRNGGRNVTFVPGIGLSGSEENENGRFSLSDVEISHSVIDWGENFPSSYSSTVGGASIYLSSGEIALMDDVRIYNSSLSVGACGQWGCGGGAILVSDMNSVNITSLNVSKSFVNQVNSSSSFSGTGGENIAAGGSILFANVFSFDIEKSLISESHVVAAQDSAIGGALGIILDSRFNSSSMSSSLSLVQWRLSEIVMSDVFVESSWSDGGNIGVYARTGFSGCSGWGNNGHIPLLLEDVTTTNTRVIGGNSSAVHTGGVVWAYFGSSTCNLDAHIRSSEFDDISLSSGCLISVEGPFAVNSSLTFVDDDSTLSNCNLDAGGGYLFDGISNYFALGALSLPYTSRDEFPFPDAAVKCCDGIGGNCSICDEDHDGCLAPCSNSSFNNCTTSFGLFYSYPDRQCSSCPGGQYGVPSRSVCSNCPPGTYFPVIEAARLSDKCMPCIDDGYCIGGGCDVCANCSDGFVWTNHSGCSLDSSSSSSSSIPPVPSSSSQLPSSSSSSSSSSSAPAPAPQCSLRPQHTPTPYSNSPLKPLLLSSNSTFPLQGRDSDQSRIALSPNGRRMALGLDDDTVAWGVWDDVNGKIVISDEVILPNRYNETTSSVTLAESGLLVVVGGRRNCSNLPNGGGDDDSFVSLFDTNASPMIHLLDIIPSLIRSSLPDNASSVPNSIRCLGRSVSISLDGTVLALSTANGWIYVLDLTPLEDSSPSIGVLYVYAMPPPSSGNRGKDSNLGHCVRIDSSGNYLFASAPEPVNLSLPLTSLPLETSWSGLELVFVWRRVTKSYVVIVAPDTGKLKRKYSYEFEYIQAIKAPSFSAFPDRGFGHRIELSNFARTIVISAPAWGEMASLERMGTSSCSITSKARVFVYSRVNETCYALSSTISPHNLLLDLPKPHHRLEYPLDDINMCGYGFGFSIGISGDSSIVTVSAPLAVVNDSSMSQTGFVSFWEEGDENEWKVSDISFCLADLNSSASGICASSSVISFYGKEVAVMTTSSIPTGNIDIAMYGCINVTSCSDVGYDPISGCTKCLTPQYQYSPKHDKCNPVCAIDGCEKGSCIAPDVCTCRERFDERTRCHSCMPGLEFDEATGECKQSGRNIALSIVTAVLVSAALPILYSVLFGIISNLQLIAIISQVNVVLPPDLLSFFKYFAWTNLGMPLPFTFEGEGGEGGSSSSSVSSSAVQAILSLMIPHARKLMTMEQYARENSHAMHLLFPSNLFWTFILIAMCVIAYSSFVQIVYLPIIFLRKITPTPYRKFYKAVQDRWFWSIGIPVFFAYFGLAITSSYHVSIAGDELSSGGWRIFLWIIALLFFIFFTIGLPLRVSIFLFSHRNWKYFDTRRFRSSRKWQFVFFNMKKKRTNFFALVLWKKFFIAICVGFARFIPAMQLSFIIVALLLYALMVILRRPYRYLVHNFVEMCMAVSFASIFAILFAFLKYDEESDYDTTPTRDYKPFIVMMFFGLAALFVWMSILVCLNCSLPFYFMFRALVTYLSSLNHNKVSRNRILSLDDDRKWKKLTTRKTWRNVVPLMHSWHSADSYASSEGDEDEMMVLNFESGSDISESTWGSAEEGDGMLENGGGGNSSERRIGGGDEKEKEEEDRIGSDLIRSISKEDDTSDMGDDEMGGDDDDDGHSSFFSGHNADIVTMDFDGIGGIGENRLFSSEHTMSPMLRLSTPPTPRLSIDSEGDVLLVNPDKL